METFSYLFEQTLLIKKNPTGLSPLDLCGNYEKNLVIYLVRIQAKTCQRKSVSIQISCSIPCLRISHYVYRDRHASLYIYEHANAFTYIFFLLALLTIDECYSFSAHTYINYKYIKRYCVWNIYTKDFFIISYNAR